METVGKNPINDLDRVGPDKPLGYLPLDTVINICERDPMELAHELEGRGLKTKIFSDGECLRRGGMLYTYDEVALGALLKVHAGILHDAHWPETPHEFVTKSATTRAELYTKLFTVIADAFADYDNQYRVEL